MNITLVEDDPIQQKLLQNWLEQAGYNCRVFGDGQSLIEQFSESPIDLLILDWELPDQDGLSLLHWLRTRQGDNTPVLFLTMRDDEDDVVAALRGGADDYLVKPARYQELLARIEANLRRTQLLEGRNHKSLQIGPFIIDRLTHRLTRDGDLVNLTQKEFSLACHLLSNLGRVVSRSELLERIWGQPNSHYSRTVDTHVSRLRKKLELVPEQGWQLTSIYQSGYRLDWLGE